MIFGKYEVYRYECINNRYYLCINAVTFNMLILNIDYEVNHIDITVTEDIFRRLNDNFNKLKSIL